VLADGEAGRARGGSHCAGGRARPDARRRGPAATQYPPDHDSGESDAGDHERRVGHPTLHDLLRNRRRPQRESRSEPGQDAKPEASSDGDRQRRRQQGAPRNQSPNVRSLPRTRESMLQRRVPPRPTQGRARAFLSIGRGSRVLARDPATGRAREASSAVRCPSGSLRVLSARGAMSTMVQSDRPGGKGQVPWALTTRSSRCGWPERRKKPANAGVLRSCHRFVGVVWSARRTTNDLGRAGSSVAFL